MPHTPSAKKHLRKSLKHKLHNRSVMKDMRTQIKKVETTAGKGTVEELRKEFRLATKKLDKAAAKRVIHPNLAARKKSQLARLLHQKETAGKAAPPSK